MLVKLKIKGAVIRDLSAQFYYVHNRLKGRALQIVTAFIKEMHQKNTLDPYRFINYLSSIYKDLNIKEKANNKLNALRQGKKRFFLRFLLIFKKLLLKTGGLWWPDKNKILALKAALHPALWGAFITVKPPASYDEYIRELMGIALRKKAAKTASIAWHPYTPRSTA